MRPIDADKLRESVLKWLPPDPCGQEEKEYPFETDICVSLLMEIEEAPTIEPRSGRWIPHHDKVMLFDGMSIGGMACSVCGWKTHNKMHLLFGCPYKYCPNCGAEMEGE